MSIKQRLIKLEAQQGDENIALINKETSQWARLYLDDLIQRINDGTYISKPWVISPIPPNIGSTKAFLHDTLNKIAARKNEHQTEIK